VPIEHLTTGTKITVDNPTTVDVVNFRTHQEKKWQEVQVTTADGVHPGYTPLDAMQIEDIPGTRQEVVPINLKAGPQNQPLGLNTTSVQEALP